MKRGHRGRHDPVDDRDNRTRHVSQLLGCHGLRSDERVARAWVRAFDDDEDPTFVVKEWIDAGPVL
jgi:hypothetical protein